MGWRSDYYRIEIGSEFWSIPTKDHDNGLFTASTQWYQSGRSALRAILAENRFRTAALPSWCCESMIQPFLDAGVEVSFYHAMEETETDADVTLVMDYFGYRREPMVRSNGRVIRDLTHSVLCGSYDDADYFFGSLRKWAGFLTGGFAWTQDGHALPEGKADNTEYVRLRRAAMQQKKCYLFCEPDDHGAVIRDKRDLGVFSEAEELLEHTEILTGDLADAQAARLLDVDKLREQRRENASVLLDAVSNMALFPELKEQDVPLFVPIRVPDGKRDALRAHLREQAIYCPIHWPLSSFHQLNDSMQSLYEDELSLVCDQRYGTEEMNRIAAGLKEFL